MPRAPAAVRLPDGRSLSYFDLGDPAGRPVLLFHGTPACAAGWLFADGPARELGVRAIAPDRPGIGASSFQPGRRLLGYPADVLGFPRFRGHVTLGGLCLFLIENRLIRPRQRVTASFLVVAFVLVG